MIGRGDFWLAVAAAAGFHAAALVIWAPGDAGGGAGAEGNASVSVAAVDPALHALVETWTRPPDATTETNRMTEPSTADAPAMPKASTAPKLVQSAPNLPLPVTTDRAPDRADAPLRPTAPEMEPMEIEIGQVSRPRAAPPAPKALDRMKAPTPPPTIDTAPPEQTALVRMPRPDPRPSRPQVAERRATGSGGGATAGQVRTNAVQRTTANAAADQARWAAQIQQRIARHQAYPRGTRASGRVRVSMVILRNGALGEVSVARSSGASRLDQAALRAVERAAPFPPAPESLTDGWFRVGQWISFERR